MVKNLCANAGDAGDTDSVSGSERSPGRGNDNPLQYSCLENPMDRGAWWGTVHGVTKSQTRLKGLSMHTPMNGMNIHIILTILRFASYLFDLKSYFIKHSNKL